MPGPGWYLIGEDEIASVTEALSSGEISRYRFDGSLEDPSKVYLFEREFADTLGAAHCIGMNSATSALLSALVATGIGPGDEVIVPGYTFIASIAAVVHAGATPVLAEIDDSLTLDPQDVAAKCTPRTRAVLPVHMLGRPADMVSLTTVAEEHGLLVIEDVAQACGGSFRGRRLGTWGTAGAFSLNGAKVITGSDGGVLVTGERTVYERAFAFHDHGSAPLRLGVTDHGPLLGLNLRMSELVGAMALAQLRKLDHILDTLRARHDALASLLTDLPGVHLARSNDPAGHCATTLALTCDTAARARQITEVLGTAVLDASPRHTYWRMSQLRSGAQRRIAGKQPFRVLPDTVRGTLPRTDGLLERTFALSVGVVDPYLGTGFGIDITTDDERLHEVARAVREAAESAGPSPSQSVERASRGSGADEGDP
ncbi:DegT/DnrJ/EryC1/StrS family aminotransferase [Streptomyces chrestomyceticus]|uniref:DegT/DnrJ/EryC1/StrS family aminotransferase n=1 Tax=Streptomyces chrestomyceticus TaxID=68185 RepID=UPI0033D1BB40